MREAIMRTIKLLVFGIAGSLVTLPALARPSGEGDEKREVVKDYTLGPGDVFTGTVADAPEFGGKFRVSDSGAIQLTGVKNPVAAEGRTASELASEIRQALIDARQLRDPQVSVFVDEYHGRTVTVIGAVAKPSVYSLQ